MDKRTKSRTDAFDNTLQGLNAGLRVEHIMTFNIQTCRDVDSAKAVLRQSDLSGFDFLPVRNKEGSIVGVLERGVSSKGTVHDAMSPLDEKMLIPADSGLLAYVNVADTRRYRLVFNEQGVCGIVTHSDLLKLPVRVLAFSYISQLEAGLAALIRSHYEDGSNDWMSLLKDKRRAKVLEKRDLLMESRIDPDLLELTDLCDKREIVRKTFDLGSPFKSDLEQIEKLRNELAHSATFIQDESDVAKFVARLKKAAHWIEQVSQLLSKRHDQ